MSDIVIKAEDISKLYRLGNVNAANFKDDLSRTWASIRGKVDPAMARAQRNTRNEKTISDYVWALQNINFEVKHGEVLGIIGRNGAGKSTLLKILSKVTAPTTGNIKVKGRIASLLEVGTGFHPELTGKENVFLNGHILGMNRHEIARKFDEIVEFAGVEKYLDTPVKRYSSGMYVRLAFAVAAHLEPEILIIDEVLAVGDADFQKKCLGKMQDVSRNDGRTILFVSHNMPSIRQLCRTGLLLNDGSVELAGTSEEVIRQYFHQGRDISVKPPVENYRNYDISTAPIYIENVYLPGYETLLPILPIGAEVEIVIRVKVKSKVTNANVSVGIYNSDGINVGIAFSWDNNFYLTAEEGIHEIVYKLKNVSLSPSQYFIGVGLNQSDQTNAWDGISLYPLFFVENQNNVEWYTNRPWGSVHLQDSSWQIKKIN